MENRIMMQLSFAGSPHQRVAEIFRLLDTIGLEVTILPNIGFGKRAVLVVPRHDMAKARDAFSRLRIDAKEREVLVIHVENRPGTIAGISRKISDSGISINYAYLGSISPFEGFLVLGCSDNRLALRALECGSAGLSGNVKPMFL
jgi:hypothetical protein